MIDYLFIQSNQPNWPVGHLAFYLVRDVADEKCARRAMQRFFELRASKFGVGPDTQAHYDVFISGTDLVIPPNSDITPV
jgi:hypothetical protein